MWIVLAWVVFSYLCGKYGEKKGLSFTKFFWISLLISPVIGFIWCAISMEDMDMVEDKKIITKQSKRCPYCKELIKVGASICKHCQKDLNKKTFVGTNDVCSSCGEKRTSMVFKVCQKCGKFFPK